MPGLYISNQTEDCPVSFFLTESARLRYAFWRSRENILGGQSSRAFLALRTEGCKHVFVVCDGVDGSFKGEIAARILGENLLMWLWDLEIEDVDGSEEIQARLGECLKEWRAEGQTRVDTADLSPAISQTARNELEQLRVRRGSEAIFVCGRLDARSESGYNIFVARGGNAFLQVNGQDGRPAALDLNHYRDSRWSTLSGMTGEIEVIHWVGDENIGQILAGVNGLEDFVDRFLTTSDLELQNLIEEKVLEEGSDDIALVEISVKEQTQGTEDEVIEGCVFEPGGDKIDLHQDGSTLAWDAPENTVYSIIEERRAAGVWTVYVGPEHEWVVPDEPVNREYRVTVMSPTGSGFSGWIEVAGLESWIAEGEEVFQTDQPVELAGDEEFADILFPVEQETAPETPFEQPPEPQPSKLWKPQEAIKARITRGEQAGEYLIEWDSLAGVDQYEVQEFFGGEKHETSVSETRLALKDPKPGFHTFRVRGSSAEVLAEWDILESTVLNVPGRIETAPTNLKVILNKDKTITVQWKPLKSNDVEQYRVYEVVEKGRKLAGAVGDLDRCLVEPETLASKITFVVCAANWSGEGPASRPVVFDPALRPGFWGSLWKKLNARPAAQKRVRADEPKADVFRCKTRDEVCLEITRRLSKAHIRMTGLQVEQKYQGTEEYRSIDKRNTTELISLNLEKGPEYRMIIYGSKGEKWLIPITFDRLTWDFILKFTPISKKK